MKKFITSIAIFFALVTVTIWGVSAGFLSDLFDGDWAQPYICQNDDCGADNGIAAVSDALEWSEKNKPASQYIQDIVNYVLTFMAIVWVLYIIYAGFNILTAAGDDEKVSNSKKTITYVVIGLLIMFLAYSIIAFIFGIFDEASTPNTTYPIMDDTGN